MCGILGMIGEKPLAFPHRYFEQACGLMAHRGPDDSGFWQSPEGRVWLGHRRLSILDLSPKGHQPMQDRSGRLVIVFNGEIYNYVEIREELKRLGHCFETGSDTEVILEAFKEWGERCLDRFNGMFSFALYDIRKRMVFCARDRYGEKPFLFVQKRGMLAFASEYKALLNLPGVTTAFDEFRLVRGLQNASMGLDAEPQTVFNDIRQLMPGEMAHYALDSDEFHVQRYWEVLPNADFARLSEVDAVARFRDTLVDSIRIRMRSDVPVGSCLSGGLDSSAIVCVVRKLLHSDGDYHTFTGRFPGTRADEWEYARQVVDQTRVVSHVVEPTADGFASELPAFMWFNELPVGSSSQYAQWCVFRLAKEQGVTVLLDGQGADELLGGYEQYFSFYAKALRESGQHDRLARELPAIRARYPLALMPPSSVWRDRLPFPLRRWLAYRLGRGSSLLFGLKPEVASRVMEANVRVRDQRFHALGSALAQDSFGHFLTTLLRYGDRNSMAHSREVRLPFCDHRLAELALSLPPQHLMGEIQTKRLLRESMRGLLPESIRTRWNKQGFLPPQENWFQGRLLEMAADLLRSRTFRESPYWEAAWWDRIISRIQRGEGALGWSLWQPFMSEAWKRHFLSCVKEPAR